MSWRHSILVLLLALIDASLASSATPDQTASNHIEFSGNETFSSSVLLTALRSDLEFVLTATPSSSNVMIAETVGQRIRDGYRASGFADPDIFVEIKELGSDTSLPRLKVQITEGPRFRAGRIEIQAPAEFDQGQLRKRLATPYPPSDAMASYELINGQRQEIWLDEEGDEVRLKQPHWIEGEPVKFDSIQRLNEHCQQVFAAMGYSRATYISRIETDEKTELATWHVDVLETGPPDIIEAIQVQGTIKNDQDSLISLLNLEPGLKVNAETLSSWRKQLFETNRFASSQVVYEIDEAGIGQLIVRVEEINELPALNEDL
ncbi:MAG: hypothetical protein AAF745_10515, partial [Planctomycetota bacterium]